MPMKQTGRKVYKSMQGKQIDMDLLRQKNELTPAVGNAKVNASADAHANAKCKRICECCCWRHCDCQC